MANCPQCQSTSGSAICFPLLGQRTAKNTVCCACFFSPCLDGKHCSLAAPQAFLEAPSVPVATLVPNVGVAREVPVLPGSFKPKTVSAWTENRLDGVDWCTSMCRAHSLSDPVAQKLICKDLELFCCVKKIVVVWFRETLARHVCI